MGFTTKRACTWLHLVWALFLDVEPSAGLILVNPPAKGFTKCKNPVSIFVFFSSSHDTRHVPGMYHKTKNEKLARRIEKWHAP
jgi:hypothetical protein